jgi:zinc-ribbon domain
MSVVECPTCGAAVPAEARFCSECGSPNPFSEGVETRLRKYWSAPDLGLLVGLVLAGAGVVLLGAQVWLWAAVALVLAAAVFLIRWEAGRRRTGAAIARLSAHRRIVGARSRGQLELFRLRRELAELQAERSRGYQELGRATHAGDAHAARAATAQVDDVSGRIGAKEAEITVLLQDMEERVRRAQAEVTPTQHVEAGPEPVPEPFPPPDEGTPPAPARVPEPFPQPVPEPSPDDPPPQPEPPPPPETKRRRASRASNT